MDLHGDEIHGECRSSSLPTNLTTRGMGVARSRRARLPEAATAPGYHHRRTSCCPAAQQCFDEFLDP